jgi:hypothetical protein
LYCSECPNFLMCWDDEDWHDFDCPNQFHIENSNLIPTERKDRTRRALRRKNTFYKRERQKKICTGYVVYNPYAGWITKQGYIHESSSSSAPQFYKKESARKIRRTKEIANGNAYRKHYEYWWQLF